MTEYLNIELEPGDILSCTSNGWLGKMIQLITKSRISHSALVIDIWGELYIIDSQKDGTNPRKLDDWMKRYSYKFQVHRPIDGKFNIKNIQKRALSKSGKTPYDFKSLLWFQPIYVLTGKWVGHTHEFAEENMYCSEYVSWVYNIGRFWEKSPADLFEYLNNNKNQFELVAEVE